MFYYCISAKKQRCRYVSISSCWEKNSLEELLVPSREPLSRQSSWCPPTPGATPYRKDSSGRIRTATLEGGGRGISGNDGNNILSRPHSWPITAWGGCERWVVGFLKLEKCLIWRGKDVGARSFQKLFNHLRCSSAIKLHHSYFNFRCDIKSSSLFHNHFTHRLLWV